MGQPVTFADVEDMDSVTKKLLYYLEHVEEENVTEAQWPALVERLHLRFKVVDASGKDKELVPGGADIPVRWGARTEYCALVRRFKTREFQRQIAATARGLATQVPRNMLGLFTWQEMEELVCGRPIVDLDLLKRCTVYQGYSEDSPTIKLFWEVMDGFTEEVSHGEQQGWCLCWWLFVLWFAGGPCAHVE